MVVVALMEFVDVVVLVEIQVSAEVVVHVV